MRKPVEVLKELLILRELQGQGRGDRTSDDLTDPGQVGPGAGFQVIHMWVHRLSICGLFG